MWICNFIKESLNFNYNYHACVHFLDKEDELVHGKKSKNPGN